MDGPPPPSARKLAVGVLLLSVANTFRLGVQFLMFPLLARLLAPADFGLMALAMPVLLFALTLSDGGMGPALLRMADPRGTGEATMAWTAIAASMAMAAVLLVGATPIAGWLSHREVAPVLRWLAPILLLNAFCGVASVRAQRYGNTWIFAVGDAAATIAGVAVALYGALAGWSVWSLVAQQLVLWLVKAAILQGLAGHRFAAWPARAAFGGLMRQGLPLVGANLLTLFAGSIDNLLIGRQLGVGPLGLYALAYQIVRIPEAVLVGPVLISFLPAVARLNEDRDAAAELLLSTLRVMLGVAAPLMLGLALVADLAIALLLGPRWHGAAVVLQLLAPPAIAQALGLVSTALLLGRGRAGLQFRTVLLTATMICAGVFAGSVFGLIGIAAGVALATTAGNLFAVAAAVREVGLPTRRVATALLPTVAASAIMAAGVLGVRAVLPAGLPVIVELAVVAAAGIALYAGAMQLLSPGVLAADLAPFHRRKQA
jgi:O-antigen/teichoic acid export membrane protein